MECILFHSARYYKIFQNLNLVKNGYLPFRGIQLTPTFPRVSILPWKSGAQHANQVGCQSTLFGLETRGLVVGWAFPSDPCTVLARLFTIEGFIRLGSFKFLFSQKMKVFIFKKLYKKNIFKKSLKNRVQ